MKAVSASDSEEGSSVTLIVIETGFFYLRLIDHNVIPFYIKKTLSEFA